MLAPIRHRDSHLTSKPHELFRFVCFNNNLDLGFILLSLTLTVARELNVLSFKVAV